MCFMLLSIIDINLVSKQIIKTYFVISGNLGSTNQNCFSSAIFQNVIGFFFFGQASAVELNHGEDSFFFLAP